MSLPSRSTLALTLLLGLMLGWAQASTTQPVPLPSSAELDLPLGRFLPQPELTQTASPGPTIPPPIFTLQMPLLAIPEGPPASIRFGAGLRGSELLSVTDSFSMGLTTLYYEVEIAEAAGLVVRERWLLNGVEQPGLARRVILGPEPVSIYRSGIALSSGGLLPVGVYRLDLLLEDPIRGPLIVARREALISP